MLFKENLWPFTENILEKKKNEEPTEGNVKYTHRHVLHDLVPT